MRVGAPTVPRSVEVPSMVNSACPSKMMNISSHWLWKWCPTPPPGMSHVFRFEQNVLGVLVVVDVVLLVVDKEVFNPSRDRMIGIDYAYLERTQRWVPDVGATHHVAIGLRRERHVAVVVE